ncbi:class I adenylate-forming enzyme family protein [Nonomuraea purpurea]|uniref:Class I adenylate-forming enzyme family protein n=1 Tax=Nonomuraea purpurea TaxID=1849276 RepID=A0ABV8GAZ6_9ACTN
MKHASARHGTTAAQILWTGAELFADRACVTDLDAAAAGETFDYGTAAARAAATGGALRALGLRRGDRVAVLLHNSQSYVDVFLGALAAGLIVVPLNTRLTGEDYRHMLTDSGSRALVTTAEFGERLPEVRGLTVVLADPSADGSLPGLAAAATPLTAPEPAAETDVASLMYTSGTTGSPKAVMLTHASWRSVAGAAIDVLGFADGEVTLHVAPLTHGAGFLFLPTLMSGGHNLLCRSFDAARTAALLGSHGVTGMFVVPSMIRMLLDAVPPAFTAPPAFRRLYYAGSPIDAGTLREATAAFGGRVVQSFGQMESPMFVTVLDQEDHRRALREPGLPLVRSAGGVLPGVELRVAGDDGEPLPTGEPGEILARAPQTMAGYWNRPEATAVALSGGWLHTGDVGYLDEDGYLFLVDRKKDMIVTGGSNVYAREVEEVLLALPGVREAAVVGLPHRVWGEAVTAVLVADGSPRAEEEIIADCRARLAGYRVPKRVVWVEELPRNAYGKVLKRRLRDELGNVTRIDTRDGTELA